MTEFVERAPIIEVRQAEYQRLLGYPREHELSDRAAELSAWAREWFTRNGRPWMYAREVERFAVEGPAIRLGSERFTSAPFGRRLREAEAHTAFVAAVSAGPELEEESQRLWREEKPDEYFFLEMYGSAVVEHLTTLAGARLCEWAEPHQLAVIPHYSPGYAEWDVAEQPALWRVFGGAPLPGPLEVLDSGAIRPRKSLLAVFGVTSQIARVKPLADVVACAGCSLDACGFRRVPYLATRPAHQVNVRALKRWAAERLALEWERDGSVRAKFRYDGTTCSNMGRPLAFEYRVRLGPRESGYPITEQRCEPVAGDTGHTFMCGYQSDRDGVMGAIEAEAPLRGRPLADVLTWTRSAASAGCYCDHDARLHKWGLVLETIQYALSNREGEG